MTTMEMTTMEQITIQEQATMEMIGVSRSKLAKPVLCITDGKTFTSATDAAEYYGVHNTAISAACRGKVESCKGKKFCYVDKVKENLPVITEELQTKSGSHSRKNRHVKCTETGIEYRSITLCAKEIGVSTSKLYYHLQGKTESINGNHYILMDDECAECVREMTEIVEKANEHDELMSKIKLLATYRNDCQSCREQYNKAESEAQDLQGKLLEVRNHQSRLENELLAKSKLVQDLEAEIRNMLNL